MRHGGILDSLFTPNAVKKKNEAGYKDLLSKIDDQIKKNTNSLTSQQKTPVKDRRGRPMSRPSENNLVNKPNARFASMNDAINSSPNSSFKSSKNKSGGLK